MPNPRKDIPIGTRFGRLTVVGPAERIGTAAAWLCRCDCGTEITARGHNLRKATGSTLSCGCLQAERVKAKLTTHGHAPAGDRSPEYRTWASMHSRCIYPSQKGFRHYGGRGIRVCDEWTGPDGFERFLAHIGPKPSPELSIDRIDNDGNYEPGNVRWATASEQQRNKRRAAA